MSAKLRWMLAGLALVVCACAGCPEGGGGSDAGQDAGFDVTPGQLDVQIGKNVDGQWQAFADDGATIEVVSGFQGGYHLGPALRIERPPADSFITVVDYSVTDVDTGEELAAEPSRYRVNERTWEPRPSGYFVRPWERYILDIDDPAKVEGRTVRISVEVTVEGGLGSGSDSVVVEVVDEVNELG